MATEKSGNALLTLAQVNALSREEFVSAFGELFEHSPWIAERAWDARPFGGLDALFQALAFVLRRAETKIKFGLIRAHPELAARDARALGLSELSGKEQQSAGLDTCSAEDAQRLSALNRQYREKFGFPFILAIKGLDKAGIFEQLGDRLENTLDSEYAENLQQILKIAWFRLEALVAED